MGGVKNKLGPKQNFCDINVHEVIFLFRCKLYTIPLKPVAFSNGYNTQLNGSFKNSNDVM